MDQHLMIRQATLQDIVQVYPLIQQYALQGIVLPKNRDELTADLQKFIVAELSGEIVGCGALHMMWNGLAEIRTLVIDPKWQGVGVGKYMVRMLVNRARKLGVKEVFCLTYQEAFFAKQGFKVIDKSFLPQKIWTDCIVCPRFHCCDEIAMILQVSPGGPEEEIKDSSPNAFFESL